MMAFPGRHQHLVTYDLNQNGTNRGTGNNMAYKKIGVWSGGPLGDSI